MNEVRKSTEEKPKSRTVCVEDPAVTMVEPDTMTPSQYFERIFTESTLLPEKRLMLAVLEDAIASFQRNFIQQRGTSETEDFDVETWLESDDMSWPFSFASICQALDMEPEYLRRGLKTWRDRAYAEFSQQALWSNQDPGRSRAALDQISDRSFREGA